VEKGNVVGCTFEEGEMELFFLEETISVEEDSGDFLREM
jgi:hypothetical protein